MAGSRTAERPSRPRERALPAYSGGTAWDSHPLRLVPGRAEGKSIAHSVQEVRRCGVRRARCGLEVWRLRVEPSVITCLCCSCAAHDVGSRIVSASTRLAAAGLCDVAEKVEAGVRLDAADGLRLFETDDLLAVGYLANRVRERRHGARTYYNYNIRIEATNVCVASCLFCSFARLRPGDTGAYTLSLEQAWAKLRARAHQPLTEVHVVNGLHPGFAVRLLPRAAARLQAHPARNAPEVFHRRRDCVLRRYLRQDATNRCCAS